MKNKYEPEVVTVSIVHSLNEGRLKPVKPCPPDVSFLAGTEFLITSGCYDHFGVEGVFLVKKDFNLRTAWQDYLDSGECLDFLGSEELVCWLETIGVIEPKQIPTLHLGDYVYSSSVVWDGASYSE